MQALRREWGGSRTITPFPKFFVVKKNKGGRERTLLFRKIFFFVHMPNLFNQKLQNYVKFSPRHLTAPQNFVHFGFLQKNFHINIFHTLNLFFKRKMLLFPKMHSPLKMAFLWGKKWPKKQGRTLFIPPPKKIPAYGPGFIISPMIFP